MWIECATHRCYINSKLIFKVDITEVQGEYCVCAYSNHEGNLIVIYSSYNREETRIVLEWIMRALSIGGDHKVIRRDYYLSHLCDEDTYHIEEYSHNEGRKFRILVNHFGETDIIEDELESKEAAEQLLKKEGVNASSV